MTSKFALLSKVALGAVAVGTLFTTSAFGATSTWNNGTVFAGRNWATTSNWTGGTPGVGGQADIGPGGLAQTYGITVGADTNELSVLNFSGGSGSYVTSSSGAVVVNGAIINNLTRLTGVSGLASGATGLGSVVLQNATLNGDTNLSGSGAGTEFKATLGGDGALSVTNTDVIFNSTAISTAVSTGAGGKARFVGGPGFTELTNGAGGTFTGNGLTGDSNTFGASGDSLTLAAGSNTDVRVGWTDATTGFGDTFETNTTSLGGTLNIDWSQVGSSLFTPWTVASKIFQSDALSGNFSSVNLVGGVAPYAGLSFTADGAEWKTATFAGPGGNPEWLVFQSTTGNLVVVPEPSTMVFAGVGVAMAGWSVWKKRRLAKLAKIA
jgi:hypothetical protein